MAYRDNDEAHNFNENLKHHQDRPVHGDRDDERRYYDNSPGSIADEILATVAKAKEKEATEETFTGTHYERSRKNGVDAVESLANMGDWHNGLMNPNTTARTAAELRTYGIGAPPRPKLPEIAPPPEGREEHMHEMMKRVAIPEAIEMGAKRDALRRANPSLQHITEAYGNQAPAVINKMGEVWDMVLDDPVQAGPKVVNMAVQEQQVQRNRAEQETALNAWMQKHPEVQNDPILRNKMAKLQPWAHTAANVGDALTAALAAAKGQRHAVHTELHREDVDADVRNNPQFREYVRGNKSAGYEGW